MTVGVPVGVAVEISDEPGPKIALVTPPTKLVIGPIRPPPLSEVGDAVTAGVVGLSKGVVLPSEDGGKMTVGDE